MMAFLPALVAGVVALGAIQLFLAWSRCRVDDLSFASEMLDEHYRAANALIQDETTPDSVIRFVGYASSQAAHPALARRFARHLISGRLRKPRKAGPQTARLAADLHALTPAGREHFAAFMSTAMVSSAASDPVLSRAFLLAVNVFFSASGRADDRNISVDRAETAALDLSSNGYACAA